MLKRISLFLAVNFLVLLTISIILTVFNVGSYITPYGIDIQQLLIFSLIVGFTGSLISLALSKVMAKMMMGVKILNPNDPNLSADARLLVERVHALSKKAGLKKMPEVGYYESEEVNAFATGPTRNNALVAVSTGLLRRMDQDAVDGVLAHEVAHIANGDMITMTLIQGIINTFVVFLSRIIAYAASRLVKEEMAPIVHFVAIIVFQILFSVLGSIAVMAFSRYREFHADAGGAALAGKDKMIHALQSLKHTTQLIDDSQTSLATLKISGKRGLTMLFSSHPDLDDRIKRLQQS